MRIVPRVSLFILIAIIMAVGGYVLVHRNSSGRTEEHVEETIAAADVATSNKYGKIVFNGKEYDYEKGGGDLAAQMARAGNTNVVSLVAHKPSDILLEVNGEKVTWGEFDDFLPVLDVIAPLSLPPEATAEEVRKILAKTHDAYAAKYCNVYLRHALLAQKARKMGISVTRGEVMTALSNSLEKVSRPNRAKIEGRIFRVGSFSWREQENFLLTKKYRADVLGKQISVTDEEVEQAKKDRLAEISSAIETNKTLRPKLEGLLSDLRAGKRTFERTAEEFSDCPSSEEGGVLGEFEPDCDLLPPLKNYIFSAPTNVLSDIIETPYSYHIVKVLERKFEDEDDKRPSSVVMAHIMLEKQKVEEPLDDAHARAHIWQLKLRKMTTAAQKTALQEAQVKAAFKITLLGGKNLPSQKGNGERSNQ